MAIFNNLKLIIKLFFKITKFIVKKIKKIKVCLDVICIVKFY